jgi:hypothetical protein
MKTDVEFFIDALRPAGKFPHTLFIGIAGIFEHYSISHLTYMTRSPWMLKTGRHCQSAFHSGVAKWYISLDDKNRQTLPVLYVDPRMLHIGEGG